MGNLLVAVMNAVRDDAARAANVGKRMEWSSVAMHGACQSRLSDTETGTPSPAERRTDLGDEDAGT